jgi:hypothetical protein
MKKKILQHFADIIIDMLRHTINDKHFELMYNLGMQYDMICYYILDVELS